MAKNAFWANVLTGGGAAALDLIPGVKLQNLDFACVVTAGTLYPMVMDIDDGGAESSPDKIAPDTDAGTKMWELLAIRAAGITVPNTGLHILDTDASHDLIIKPGSDLTADKTLTVTTGDADRTLDLAENLKVLDGQDIELHASGGEKAQLAIDTQNAERTLDLSENLIVADGYNITLQALGQANFLILNEGLTIGNGHAGTLTFGNASDVLTINETLTFDGASGKALTLEENLTVSDGTNITLASVTQANTLTLYESFTIGDGFNGTLTFSAANKVLTVPVTGTQVEIAEIGTATYDDLQDLINNTISAGYVSGGLITATSPADGTIAISAIKGYIKSTDSELGVTQSFDLDGTTDFELTNNDTNYIYVDFVSGPRFQVTTTRSDIETNRQFTIGRVYRVDNVTHIVQSGIQLPNFVRICHERLKETRGFEQASGGAISETGERYIVSTGGVFYLGNNKIETTGVDTSGASTFTRHYHVAGDWASDEKSQICAADYQYDNGTALVNLSNNKYGVFWVFIHFDSDLHVVVGRGNYTLAEAQAATLPALPNIVSDFSALAAKIIIEEDDTNFLTVQGAYERFFPLSGAFEHNDTGKIQGGTTDEYYHLLSAEYTELSEWLDDVTLGSNGLTSLPEVVLVPRAAALNDVQGGMYYSNVDDSVYICTSI